MNRTTIIAVSMLFVMGGLATLAPTGVAQSDEVAVTDGTNDVTLYAGYKRLDSMGSPPQVTPVPIAPEISGPADLTGFKVFGETATTVSFELSVASFGRPNTWQPAKVDYSLCFQWSGTGAIYRFVYSVIFHSTPQTEANSFPDFQGGEMQRVQECLPHEGASEVGSENELASLQSVQYHTEYLQDDNTLRWTLPRKHFELLNPESTTENLVLDPRPAEGDKLTALKAYAVGVAGSAYATYDETDETEFAFKLNTGNEKVKVLVPANIRAGTSVGGFDTPIYGVEIGSFQTIPVTIENHLPTPIEPNITVTLLTGEAGKWDLRTLPSIPVPKMVGDTPGRATVTLIVNSDPTVAHKESIRLLVSALDQSQPQHLGAQAVDVVAVEPPRAGASTVYLHGTGSPCASHDRWINTLQSDATATGTEIPFQDCNPQGGGAATAGEIGYMFTPDVPFARDYVLSTTENAKATVVLRSVQRTPGNPAQEIEVPTIAHVTVQIMSGTTVIGEYTEEGVDLGAQQTAVPIQVPIQGQILGGFGRLVPNDKGLGIRVAVQPAARTFELGGCVQGQCTPETEAEAQQGGGRIYLVLDASKVVLPISSSERSGDIINITKSGALMSLRLSNADAERLVVTNPGGTKVFNITVRNEGVNVDTAKISARLNQTGWKAEILPTTSYKLKVGQPRSFNVRVTAPEQAFEGQTLLIEVLATSTVDKNAIAKLPLQVQVTKGQQIENDDIDENLQKVEKTEESPGFAFSVLLASMLAMLAVARRRRR